MQTSDHKVLDLLFRGPTFQALASCFFRLLAGALTQSDLAPKKKQEFDCMLVFSFESLQV